MKEPNKPELHRNVDSVKLTRGMTGKYGWEIKVNNDKPEEAIKKLTKIDKQLREIWEVKE